MSAPASPSPQQAKFVTGSTMRHVAVMTATGSIGLIAIFVVDALNLLYISMLGVQELAAAIGFAGTLMFFTVSISIGFSIAASALVARALGRGDRPAAARMGGASLLFMAVTMILLSAAVWPFLDQLAGAIGATGETRRLTTRFLQIVIPSTPLVAVGMCATSILRGAGDARRSMYATLAGGVATAILDPIFIFGFDMGLDGAALATVLSRVVLLAVGLHGAHVVHRLVALPNRGQLAQMVRPFFAIGVPAVLTQLATPVGNTYVTVEMAHFGDDAVAGWAIIGRIVPVVFGVTFALSGAIGPILGQNYGAKRHDRLFLALRDALVFVTVYCLLAWGLLALFAQQAADLFGATGTAEDLVIFFCLFAAGSFLFNGSLFVANAAFNNLGFPGYSTIFNWGRATLGVVPFVWVGAHYYGAEGVVAGWALGSVVFGVAAVIVAFRVVRRIGQTPPAGPAMPAPPSAANSPFSTGKAATLQ